TQTMPTVCRACSQPLRHGGLGKDGRRSIASTDPCSSAAAWLTSPQENSLPRCVTPPPRLPGDLWRSHHCGGGGEAGSKAQPFAVLPSSSHDTLNGYVMSDMPSEQGSRRTSSRNGVPPSSPARCRPS